MAERVAHANVESVLEHLLGKRRGNIDLESRKAQEASLRRSEAAGWLRKMVGVVAGKDLPAEPSDEHFRIGLRSGIILCIALNKVQPDAVPKVVEGPTETVFIPDGVSLSASKYFENVKNFLLAIEEMGIPSFEASDLEKGGKTSRIVNCVLALRSYHEWKQCGGNGLWKYRRVSRTSTESKLSKENSALITTLISRSSSTGEKTLDMIDSENSHDDGAQDAEEVDTSSSLRMLIRELISDKSREDIPVILEDMLIRVMEEVDKKPISKSEPNTTQIISSIRQIGIPSQETSVSIPERTEDFKSTEISQDDGEPLKRDVQHYTEPCEDFSKTEDLIELQQKRMQELKKILNAAKVEVEILQMKHLEEVRNLDKHLKGMAQVASRYESVIEENRKLYNQVQDLKGSIRVYCRVRPFLSGHLTQLSTVEDIDETTITILNQTKYGNGKKSFTFNKVFGPSSSQEEVFGDTRPLIRSVLDGYNVCIFAYGQTGSGKTHTMSGPDELTPETVGVNYRALNDLFLISEQRKYTVAYDISVQMIEIYNEQIRDLLSSDSMNKKLEIRNNSSSGMNVPNANLSPVTSTDEVINLMNLGQKNRAVGSTAMNDRSSRSHSCLTVHVRGKDLATGVVLRGCLHLVDLAGSERVDKTEASGDRLKEAQHINKSLSALGDVISSLAQKNSHIPYRNSKLTQLLQDSLEPDALGETISTLKFAERVSSVELGAAKANKEGSDVKELKEQIATLKAALARKDEAGWYPQHPPSGSPESWSAITDTCKIEVQSTSSSTSRRHSLDSQDLFLHSSPWTSLTEEEKEEFLIHDVTSKLYPVSAPRRHSLDNVLAGNRCESVVIDDSDEGDSLELECGNHRNLAKCNSMPNVMASKNRRPSTKATKSKETSRSLIPQPSRKSSIGIQSAQSRVPTRQTSVAGRRKTARGDSK